MKKKLLLLVSIIGFHQAGNAQSYDGKDDTKIFLGYTNIGSKSGIDFQVDRGLSDLISCGARMTVLINPDNRKTNNSVDEGFKAFDAIDASAFLRFHFSEPLRLSEKIDPFISLDAGLRSIGANIGVKYNFSEVIGIYAFYGYSFSNSFGGAHNVDTVDYDTFENNVNYFGKKNSIACGVTFNIF